MPPLETLKDKPIIIKLRDGKPVKANVASADQIGVWLSGASELVSGITLPPHIQRPSFFVPWTSVDWIAASQ